MKNGAEPSGQHRLFVLCMVTNIHAGHIQKKPSNKKKPFSETLVPQGLYSSPNVDSLDWKDLSAGEITRRVTTKVCPGSIVLFHNAAKHTPEALPGIIECLLQEGYTFLPISQMILTGEYTIDHTGRQCPA